MHHFLYLNDLSSSIKIIVFTIKITFFFFFMLYLKSLKILNVKSLKYEYDITCQVIIEINELLFIF